MSTSLRITPDALTADSLALSQIAATEIGACLADLQRIRHGLAGAWSGEAAGAFDRRFGDWRARYRDYATDLAAIGRYLARVAAAYRANEARLARGDAFDAFALGDSDAAPHVRGKPVALDGDGTIDRADLERYAKTTYRQAWQRYLEAWQADVPFMLALNSLKPGYSIQVGNDIYSRVIVQIAPDGALRFTDPTGTREVSLASLAGKGPYKILDENSRLIADPASNFGATGGWLSTPMREAYQPIYTNTSTGPVFTGHWRVYEPIGTQIQVTLLDVAMLGGSVATVTKGGKTVIQASAAQLVKVLGPRAAALLPASAVLAPLTTIAVLAVTVDSTGTLYVDGYTETELPDGFWNQPGWRQPAPGPDLPPATGAPPAPWSNPNGPAYPGVPDASRP